jgi:hypothetical protein
LVGASRDRQLLLHICDCEAQANSPCASLILLIFTSEVELLILPAMSGYDGTHSGPPAAPLRIPATNRQSHNRDGRAVRQCGQVEPERGVLLLANRSFL